MFDGFERMAIKARGGRRGSYDEQGDSFESSAHNMPFDGALSLTAFESYFSATAVLVQQAPFGSQAAEPVAADRTSAKAPAATVIKQSEAVLIPELTSVDAATIPGASRLRTAVTSVSSTSNSSSSTIGASTNLIPSWISSLSTATISCDMASAACDGIINYSELQKLFSNLGSTLTSTGATLTATQLADLRLVASNLNNGISTSSYLTSITGSFVNGSTYNTTWTGGGATSVALGNLAVGSAATQFSQLYGKWFLGTDLSSSTVTVSGSTFKVSYSTSSNSLVAPDGYGMDDVNQGYLGNCYFLAPLAEVADQNPDLISSMFTSNGNGTYGVRLFVNGVAQYVTVNSSLANGGSLFNHDNELWASLAEKAYAQVGGFNSTSNSWTKIGNGGSVERALAAITGASTITDYFASGGSWGKVTYNSSLSMTGYSAGQSTAAVLSSIVAALDAGNDVVLASYTNATNSAGKQTLVKNHAMSIYGYNSSTGMLQVRNPWGNASGQYWATTFEVSLSTLLAAGDTITVDNAAEMRIASTSTTSSASFATTRSEGIGMDGLTSNFVQAVASLSSELAVTSTLSQTGTNSPIPLASPLA
uniref:Peptidase C2, calpain n=1 Tax=Rhodopseudomonas palustris (strain BisA53) TaxID=316055 RepID=Q07SP7_RHOP5